MQDPILTISNLLQDNWNASNTSSTTPNIHTGKYRESDPDPQVSVTGVDEGPMGGGDTGYAAFDSTGKGGVQEIDGLVDIGCWDNYNRNDDVKQLVYEMKEEVIRIVMANQLGATDLRFISPGPYQLVVEDDDPPVRLHGIQQVGYIFERRPS